jgi:hypothetical protein
MKLGLGPLAALILALMCGEVAVLTLWRCNPDAAGGDLGCYIGGGFMLVLFGGSSSLAALITGGAVCIITRQTRRWGWFVSFLALTVLVVAAPTLLLLNANAPSLGFTHQDDSLLRLAVLLLPLALAILTFIYLLAITVMERGRTAPALPSSSGDRFHTRTVLTVIMF